MKSKPTCFILYFVSMVISVNVHGKFIGDPLRSKSQSDDPNDDRWIWGYYTPNEPSVAPRQGSHSEAEKELITTTEAITTTTEVVQTPCTQKAPVMPDFSAPGRRISEQKCFEYIFNIKYRQEEARIQKECKAYEESMGRTYYEPNRFVVGGTNAAPGEYPHMVAVGWPTFAESSYVFKCGGTLISDQFVLTAGHCIKSGPDTTLTNLVPTVVALGDRQLVTVENGYVSYLRGIGEIIPHPQYKSPNQYYDIALIKVAQRLWFDSAVHPACLWPHFDTSILGNQAAVTGWGVVDITNRTTSPILQQAIIDMVDSGTCDSLLKTRCNRKWCGLQDTQICAGKLAGGVDACQGDSGGPLQMKINLPANNASMYYVIGVTSFGFGCAIPDIPGVYTRVSAFVDWIEGIVWP